MHRAYRADYGPKFATEGVVTLEPPRIGTAFPILVPQVDADGNGVAGVRMPELAVPLATYTGWNLFNDRSGPTDVLSSMQGSYLPLRAHRRRSEANERSAARRSTSAIATRISTSAQVTKAAQALIDQGFLLAEDLAPVLKNAARHWDYLATPAAPPHGRSENSQRHPKSQEFESRSSE